MNGRWWITADGRLPYGTPWLRLASGRAIAVADRRQAAARWSSESRARNDPALMQLGPDPLRPGFDVGAAAARACASSGAGREIGDALLDQRIIAGIGNAIRNEACFAAGISPWRKVDELSDERARAGRRRERAGDAGLDRQGPPAARRSTAPTRSGCPRCGGPVRSRGQGDDNRTAYWCPRCQA